MPPASWLTSDRPARCRHVRDDLPYDGGRFYRLPKSDLVSEQVPLEGVLEHSTNNLNLVRQVKPHTNGECFLVLQSGAEVKVSRSYRDVVARFVH